MLVLLLPNTDHLKQVEDYVRGCKVFDGANISLWCFLRATHNCRLRQPVPVHTFLTKKHVCSFALLKLKTGINYALLSTYLYGNQYDSQFLVLRIPKWTFFGEDVCIPCNLYGSMVCFIFIPVSEHIKC